MELLESDKSALDTLSKVLKIDSTIQYATAHEFISSYEKRFGQLPLEKWKNIFQRLGYLDNFYQCIAADQTNLIAASTDMGNENCSGSLVARSDCNTPVGSQPVDNQLQDQSFDRPATANGTGEHTCDVSEASANGEFLYPSYKFNHDIHQWYTIFH